jgi:PKD repeat protein
MEATRHFGRAALIVPITALAVATCREPRDATAPPYVSADSASSVATVAPESDTPAPDILVGAGDIASCTTNNDEATAVLLDGIAGTVFTLGDNAYSAGTGAEYADCYGPTWGRHKDRTRPAPGDKDYATLGAAGYFNYFGSEAGDPTKGYYSYDLPGGWHVVVLNSSLSSSQLTAQLAWLKADLKASAKECTIAYWHKPYFSSSLSPSSSRRPMWETLYGFGAEIILGADSKYYERYARQDPSEVADEAFGIRQFIVGTGGAGRTAAPSSRRVNSQVLNSGTPGVLKLTLAAGRYEWQFVPIAGMTFTDAGTGTCHGHPPPVARPGGPYRAEATVTFNGSASVDYQEDNPLTYTWDFGDGSPTAAGDKPTHTYLQEGVYTATLVVADALGNLSAPATTTVTIGNQPPVVELFSKSAALGTATAPKLTFSDAGGDADGPWTYSVDWGDGAVSTGTVTVQGVIPVSHVYPAVGKYLATATVTDIGGASAGDPANMTVILPIGGAVIAAAGDIAKCNVSGGEDNDELTAQLLDQIVASSPTATFFTLGDNAYPGGSAADYAACYEPTWGRHKSRTYAALGNHEYETTDAANLRSAAGSFSYFGSRAGEPGTHPSCTPAPDASPTTAESGRRTCEGYYSLDVGNWHIVVLNDNLGPPAAERATMATIDDGIGSSSGQLAWLRNDLTASAASGKKCQIVIWHQPRHMSSDDAFILRTTRKALWDRLFAFGVELALNAHQHFYERHHPMNPDGVRDDAAGVRQFMVGTGGESTHAPGSLTTISPNSVVRSGDFGVLKLTLHANAYEWKFIPSTGYTFTDSGSGVCH